MTEASIGILGRRVSNTLPEIVNSFQNGEHLTYGSSAKVLHLVKNLSQKEQLRSDILRAQGTYWQNWWEFRCLPAGEGKPNFDDVVSLLPVRREFTDFTEFQPKTLAVDLMAGSGNMAPYFQETGKLSGYIGIDSNSFIEETARKRLSKSGINHGGFILHDLSKGLPEAELSSLANGVSPEAVQFTSMWGITYLDAERFVTLAKQCLSLDLRNGVKPTLSFCMITDGSFDPKVLRKRFMKEIFPRELRKLHFRPLVRAIKAIPQMMEFGRTFREVSPIWYPDEIVTLLKDDGVSIDKVDYSLLWGQSTAIKVSAS